MHCTISRANSNLFGGCVRKDFLTTFWDHVKYEIVYMGFVGDYEIKCGLVATTGLHLLLQKTSLTLS